MDTPSLPPPPCGDGADPSPQGRELAEWSIPSARVDQTGSGALIYLHGFKSSPRSAKAEQLRAAAAAKGIAFACPTLPVSAREAVAQVEDLMAASPGPVTLIGSSLGGHYATWLAEKHGCPAILVNPAVVAQLSLEQYLGEQANFHSGEVFTFTRQHIAELQALDVPAISRPERYWLLLEQGDEVLDYRQAQARYAGARQTVLAGGNHSFSRWQGYLDGIFLFAQQHQCNKAGP